MVWHVSRCCMRMTWSGHYSLKILGSLRQRSHNEYVYSLLGSIEMHGISVYLKAICSIPSMQL